MSDAGKGAAPPAAAASRGNGVAVATKVKEEPQTEVDEMSVDSTPSTADGGSHAGRFSPPAITFSQLVKREMDRVSSGDGAAPARGVKRRFDGSQLLGEPTHAVSELVAGGDMINGKGGFRDPPANILKIDLNIRQFLVPDLNLAPDEEEFSG